MQVRKFTSTEIQDECKTRDVHLPLAATDYQEINGQVKVIWRTLRTISHSLMVHARVREAYINFTLIYRVDHILPVLPTKDLINEDGNPNTPFKLAIVPKPSISHLRVLFCPRVVQESTAHVGTKALNIFHQS